MSWDAELTSDREGRVAMWNYTHNINTMVNMALEAEGWERGPSPYDGRWVATWWELLDGMTGAEGARFLTVIVRGLEADPERFRAMNPPNGWGSYDGLVPVLREMLKSSCAEEPCRWSACG